MTRQEEVTGLLVQASNGDRDSFDRLLPIVYEQLQRVAHRQLGAERPDHTLNTTALVHEVYLKLVDLDRVEWKSRAHFYAIAARAMRRVLIDYAVRRKTAKRGGGRPVVTLDDAMGAAETRVDQLLALNDALKRLETIDERNGRIVECRFFGGLNIVETAEVLAVSPATVKRGWTMARAWLNRELSA